MPIANTEDAVGERIDVVIVGLHTEFDYGRLDRAARAIRNGARLIGTNSDTTFPTSTGEAPGGGAFLPPFRRRQKARRFSLENRMRPWLLRLRSVSVLNFSQRMP